MGSVTKATPIQFINSKSRIKKRRGCKTALSGYYTYLSHDLLLMASGADTHTYTNICGRNDFKKPGAACGPLASGLKRGIEIKSEKYENKLRDQKSKFHRTKLII